MKEIGLHLQILLTVVYSILKIIGMTMGIYIRNSQTVLPITLTKASESGNFFRCFIVEVVMQHKVFV